MKRLTVGHTPDSDDAFMFYGMFEGKIDRKFKVEHVIQDIEGLNKRAGDLDVTAVSVHACAFMGGYTILRSGGSFGLGYGPIVIARNHTGLDGLRIAVPGARTSAFMLLQLMIGKFEYVEMNFSDIPSAVRDGSVDAGLVIHETQLSYADEGSVKVADVGGWWHDTTALPVPLGVNVMRTDLGADAIRAFDGYLHNSIVYGRAHFEDALEYSMRYSRGKPRELISRFVRMYVNDLTVDMGDAGAASIRKMFEMAAEKKLLPPFSAAIAPPMAP